LKVLNSKSETIIRGRRDNAMKAKRTRTKRQKILDRQFNRTDDRKNEFSTRGGGGVGEKTSEEIFNDELILQGS
jgi:hypothetical protein